MFAEDLIFLIEEAHLGTYGTDLFKGSKAVIPEGPGPFTSIIETGGASPVGTHNSVAVPAYVRPSAQIVVRAEDYDVAMTRAREIYSLLFPIRNRFVNGTWWVKTQLIQEPFDLQLDDNELARVAFNLDCEKRLSAATS